MSIHSTLMSSNGCSIAPLDPELCSIAPLDPELCSIAPLDPGKGSDNRIKNEIKIPVKVYEKIIEHCKNCTFYHDNDLILEAYDNHIALDSDQRSTATLSPDHQRRSDDDENESVEQYDGDIKDGDIKDSIDRNISKSRKYARDIKDNDRDIKDNDRDIKETSIHVEDRYTDMIKSIDREITDKPERVCMLKLLVQNNFSTELPSKFIKSLHLRKYAHWYIDYISTYDNMNILHFLCMQNILLNKKNTTKKLINHQQAVGKLLRETLLDFDVDRYLLRDGIMGHGITLISTIAHFHKCIDIRTSLKIILDHGADVNKSGYKMPTYERNSLLYYYIYVGYIDGVYILLKAGYNIEIEFNYGNRRGNIYQYYLERIIHWKKRNLKRKKRVIKILKGWQWFKNVLVKMIYRIRRRKLSEMLNSICIELATPSNINLGFINISPIIADYAFVVKVVNL